MGLEDPRSKGNLPASSAPESVQTHEDYVVDAAVKVATLPRRMSIVSGSEFETRGPGIKRSTERAPNIQDQTRDSDEALSLPLPDKKNKSASFFGKLNAVLLSKPQQEHISKQAQGDAVSQGQFGLDIRHRPFQHSLLLSSRSSLDDEPLNDKNASVDDGDETENGESWSSAEESDLQKATLSAEARTLTELVLDSFWNVFNQRSSELYRQTAGGNQRSSSSTGEDSGFQKVHRSGTIGNNSGLLRGKPRLRGDDNEDDGRVPKRGKIEAGLPGDKLENTRYSCPYRKHDRMRYNIHTHRTCALSWFPTIARLK
jgi:hypothetical protein